MDHLTPQQQQIMRDNEAAALAAELFDHFCAASTMRQVLGLGRSMCETIGLRPAPLNEFYPKLKANVKNWKAQALWKKFDMRAAHRVYNKGTSAQGTRVLVIGGGPCGLRTAIEAQLLGAKVVVIEKRDRMSRNNVLHLWPFVITDLRNLGAKKFYGKFCAGSIDHISIRQLQCMLLKVALLLGVEIHEGVSFDKVIEPKDGCGWRAKVSPEDHAVSHYEFDVLIGADGKRNTLEGFKRKEFRGKLAIAITANFINKKTEAEAKVEEISGVAFIFNQSFFKDLYQQTGIDLENIVYYKDETHYFVMTAKKHSLIDKGVIQQDFTDPAELLANVNVNSEKLLDYAREAADFSTKYQMPNLEFAVNHYGKPDVAMFDFTSMFQAESSCKVIVRNNYRLLQCLVGDSLLEPFWPTGSGCARGFLSSMDAAYAIRSWNNQRNSILAVLAQRESIYRLLAQTTPENLHRDIGSYTLDPATRYPNLNKASVTVYQVKHLLDSDDAALNDQIFADTLTVAPLDIPQRRKRRTAETSSLSTILLRWVKAQLKSHEFTHSLASASECFTHGKVLCVLINRYRPDLINLTTINEYDGFQCNDLAFTILEKEFGIMRIITSQESLTLETVEAKVWLNYLEQICEVFRGEIPHIKHPKLDFAELKEKVVDKRIPDFSNLLKFNAAAAAARKVKSPSHDVERAKRDLSAQNALLEHGRRAKKRRSHDKLGGNVVERMQRLQEIETNRLERQSKRRMQRAQQTENFYKSLHMLQANNLLRESDENSKPFEDYSLFMYRQTAPEFNSRVKDLEKKLLYPDRERGIASAFLRSTGDDQFTDRIKYMEQRITGRGATGTDKKPKDLLRAIGKIESNDWNIKEIEKKMEQSKKTEVLGKHREKVPKWSKEQFQARQHKMSKPEVQEENKFKEIDNTIKNLDKQLKEGSVLERGERGKNKVASIAGQLVKKTVTEGDIEKSNIQKSNSKSALVFNPHGLSEKCHFCDKKVYLMEKISAEGLVLHRSCLKCHHCHTNLRLGGYAFDRDDPNGLFYCTQHFRLPAKQMRTAPKRIMRSREHVSSAQNVEANRNIEAISRESFKVPRTDGGPAFDLLDRGQTPERIEFENTEALSDGEPSLDKIIDENEWTDRNFGSGSEDEDSESDLSSSEDSDSSDVMFEDANGSPLGAQTLQLASDWIGKQKYASMIDSDEDDFYDTSEDDEADSQTEGEELDRKRAIRMQEVKLKPLPFLMTDTETEVQSDTESSSPDGLGLNSATEISTDSEFDNDPMVVRQTPQIFIDDSHVMKRPTLSTTRVHVKQGIIESGRQRAAQQSSVLQQQQKDINKDNILMEFKPLVQVDPSVLRVPLKTPRPGDYMLNKTASTEGIASKKSLELKKRYLLGESTLAGGIMKSGSSSILDSKLKNFHSNISECQKLLNPAVVDTTNSASQNILNKNDELRKSKSEIITPDEKENVYRNMVNSRDCEIKKEAMIETINTTLIENTMKEKMKSPKAVETIDLVTPEKLDNRPEKATPIIDVQGTKIPSETVKANQEFIKNLEVEVNHNKMQSQQDSIENLVIDLTNDDDEDESPKTDEIVILSNKVKEEEAIKSSILESENSRTRSPAMETSIKVPLLYKKTQSESNNKKLNMIEPRMSSTSTSTTSSVDDIPHIILDSTTSPETPLSALPRLEVRDSLGQLMQIDSLMIVDGQYVGDPEDLKMIDMPAGITCRPAKSNEIIIKSREGNLIPAEDKLGPKFDSSNDNKVDTLRHLPSIPSASPQPAFSKDTVAVTTKINETPRKPPPNTLDLKEKDDPISDSETEQTGQGLTETELSDWTADDAVSENFVDFAMNSNKGTIKRNKKKNRKDKSSNSQSRASTANAADNNNGKYAPIVSKLDFEEIDFMDTGSEQEDNSCVKSIYVANKSLKQNRGYVEFVDNQVRPSTTFYANRSNHSGSPSSSNMYPSLHINEAINKEIAGIDFIEQGACILADSDLKTPVNEVQSICETPTRTSAFDKQLSALSFARKLVEPQLDSLNNDIEDDSLIMVASHDCTEKTTTEESDALTVVTSPMDGVRDMVLNGKQYDIEVTPVISRHMSQDSLNYEAASTEKAGGEDLTYENYVRELQMKISEISNARDSIDIRRSRRKSSPSSSVFKGDAGLEVFTQQTTIETTPKSITNQNETTKRIEEITKERTKQKDLIHDLVMDKLQTKKHLNQTKRLNRRSNRHGCMAPSQSSTPENKPCTLAMQQSLSTEKVTNLESLDRVVPPVGGNTTGFKVPNTKYKYPYSRHAVETAKLRLSDSDDILVQSSIEARSNPITKTQSFSHYKPLVTPVFTSINEPLRCPPMPPDRKVLEITESPADKQRNEARARARLKSSQDLGLSPDEKIQLLRKRYNLDNLMKKTPTSKNKSDDMKVRDMKMMTSKSVNDLAATATDTATSGKCDFTSDPNLTDTLNNSTKGSSPEGPFPKRRTAHKDPERRRSIIKAVSDFFHISGNNKDKKEKSEGVFGKFKLSPKSKSKEQVDGVREHCKSEDCLQSDKVTPSIVRVDEPTPPPIPPLPLHYQRSDDESYSESKDLKKMRSLSKASRQAELKRLRIAQEIQREQEEIEVKLKDLEARGVIIEKALRGESRYTIDGLENTNIASTSSAAAIGVNDEVLFTELLEIWRSKTALKKRDEELDIRQQELQLEHRHAQLKEELNSRLSCKVNKSSADVAAEGAILNEMLEIVARRATLRPSECAPTVNMNRHNYN